MTRTPLFTLTTVLLVCSFAFGRPSDRWRDTEFLSGRLIVDFSEQISVRTPELDSEAGIVQIGVPELDRLFEEFEVTFAARLVPDGILDKLRTPPDFYRTYVIAFRSEYPVLDVLDVFAACAFTKSAQPDIVHRVDLAPNDVFWQNQWDKRIVGCDVVWDYSTGNPDIICAGIDTGVDWNHPDLALDPQHPERGHILWINPEEDLDGDRSPYDAPDFIGDSDDYDFVDNDDNGLVDDFMGWDFIRNIGNCASGEDCDNQTDNDMFGLESHGTHIAGTMVAHGNNSIGVTGSAWNGTLMALRAGYLASDGQGYMPESATQPAILYAAAQGARIINMSYGSSGGGGNGQQTVNSAWNQGCMLFGASGNDHVSTPHYPANFTNVIGVNATNSTDHLADFSNYGTWTELCAPGENVHSTVINGYQTLSGTSMASPSAAGAAALIWGIFPDMTNAEMRDLLFETAEDIYPLNPEYSAGQLGHGRVSAVNALASLFPRMTITDIDVDDTQGGDGDGRLERNETAQLVFNCANEAGWSDAEGLGVVVSSANPLLSLSNQTFMLGNVAAGQSANNASDPVTVTVGEFYEWSVFEAELVLNFSSPSGYDDNVSAYVRTGRGQILLVDDDDGQNYDQNFVAALNGAQVSHDVWSTNLDGGVPPAEIQHYTAVLWECGDDTATTLTDTDQQLLTTYLNGGGDLILVGQGIDEDLRGTAFYSDYVHAQSEQMNGSRNIEGIGGNPVSDGLELLLIGSCAPNGNRGPSRILPINGAVATFNYQQGGIAGIQYDGVYKLVYCAFALEAACGNNGTDRFDDVVLRVLSWFGVQDAPENEDAPVPATVKLHGNYPNPFNPTTTLAFDLPASMTATLRVFDIQGREVAMLIDGRLNAGSHTVAFDGTTLASGVYFASLRAGEVSQTIKMALVK